VQIVALAFQHKDHLFGHVAMLSAAAPGRDLLKIGGHGVADRTHFIVDHVFEPAVPALFPRHVLGLYDLHQLR